jgi:D-sedoheptulose 7-phosphate isomerase
MTPRTSLQAVLDDATTLLGSFRRDPTCLARMNDFAEVALTTFRRDGRILTCGNGGSLAQAMHFAEEWTGRFRHDRRALPAMALADPAVITCIANDFGYEAVFARQIEAHGRRGDLLLAISTSGRSPNLLRAISAARKLDMTTVALLGKGGGPLAGEVDVPIVVPHATTSDRIQEVHLVILHAVIEAVERQLFPEIYTDPLADPDGARD